MIVYQTYADIQSSGKFSDRKFLRVVPLLFKNIDSLVNYGFFGYFHNMNSVIIILNNVQLYYKTNYDPCQQFFYYNVYKLYDYRQKYFMQAILRER